MSDDDREDIERAIDGQMNADARAEAQHRAGMFGWSTETPTAGDSPILLHGDEPPSLCLLAWDPALFENYEESGTMVGGWYVPGPSDWQFGSGGRMIALAAYSIVDLREMMDEHGLAFVSLQPVVSE